MTCSPDPIRNAMVSAAARHWDAGAVTRRRRATRLRRAGAAGVAALAVVAVAFLGAFPTGGGVDDDAGIAAVTVARDDSGLTIRVAGEATPSQFISALRKAEAEVNVITEPTGPSRAGKILGLVVGTSDRPIPSAAESLSVPAGVPVTIRLGTLAAPGTPYASPTDALHPDEVLACEAAIGAPASAVGELLARRPDITATYQVAGGGSGIQQAVPDEARANAVIKVIGVADHEVRVIIGRTATEGPGRAHPSCS